MNASAIAPVAKAVAVDVAKSIALSTVTTVGVLGGMCIVGATANAIKSHKAKKSAKKAAKNAEK